jgi:hypothetical protein
VCFYSNGDNIVAPTESAMLEGADNRHIPATGHVNLIFAPAVLEAVFEDAVEVAIAAVVEDPAGGA